LPEIGALVDSVQDIYATGITYVDTPGLRGLDTDYLISLEETAAGAERRFKETDQFRRDLYFVPWNPADLMQFFTDRTDEGKKISRYALGAAYHNVRAFFGPDQAEQFLQGTQRLLQRSGESMTTENETQYFTPQNADPQLL
jgi:hypothetical protein